MKSLFHLLICGLIVGASSLAGLAHAQSATQSVTLTAGWNAVWLEVEPTDNTGQTRPPEDVFTNPAILLAVTPKPLSGLAEFFASEPGAITTFNQDEWQQWKRTDPTGGNDLAQITGNRPYLIQVAPGTATFSITLSGNARFFRPTWNPDRYNLVGFGLQGTPTFDAFFGPSGGKHPVNKIFNLNATTGNWESVTGSSQMVSGRAYWIFSSGPSSYMGPVSVDFGFANTGKLDFGGPIDVVAVGSGPDQIELDLEEIVLSNAGTAQSTPELDLITPDPGLGNLSLYVVNPAVTRISYDRGNQVDSSAGAGASSSLGKTIGSGQTTILTLGAQRTWSDNMPRSNLYRLKTGANGASFWLPITASPHLVEQPTVPGTSASVVTGLWVGEVIFDSATSIVEDGSPVRPASGTSPMRLILHSDGGGVVKLLSQVTLMQTKSADAGIVPEPVLVVDQAKIPFFEGIKERNGNKSGIRIEAVAYDMPRKIDAASQDNLIGDPKFLLLTTLSPQLQAALGQDASTRTQAQTNLINSSTAAINAAKLTIPSLLPNYLISSGSRPPKLVEVYNLSAPMAGSVGAGQTLSGSISLDPFHRSNPFRHAYHRDLPKGPQITRTFSVDFDADQPVPGRLRGTCTETISGLIKTDLTMRGRVEFGRVSTVDTLN
ncbi:MAG: hypothetical protein V4689_09395 [Verrucomicrobiota bacterium]